jgi:hypothetical protein
MMRRMTFATLTPDIAARFARIALGHVSREYPNRLDHTIGGPADILEPHVLHPIFYGSFDWHSCVNSYWMLARLARRFPELPETQEIAGLFDARFTVANVAVELAYVADPAHRGFERTYGWVWLLKLASELGANETPRATSWSGALEPLAETFALQLIEFLPKATYPIRTGTHPNSAFASLFGLEYAIAAGNEHLADLIREKTLGWFAGDSGCQAWEPGGNDFFSSALTEVCAMQNCLERADFLTWFDRFLPEFDAKEPAALFRPAFVSDRSDGGLAHLDGYNLTRAWHLRVLAACLGPNDPRSTIARETAEEVLHSSLPHVAGEYMGEHWLATYATLALDA